MVGYYKVADFNFGISLRNETDFDKLLPSFRPFRNLSGSDEAKLFELVERESLPERPDAQLIDETVNDMGHTKLYRIDGGYRIELRYGKDVQPHIADVNPDFTEVDAFLRWDDRYVSLALSSMLRIVYSQAVLPHSAVSLHASVVVKDGKAVLFMGKSGTGKSTHSRLWLEHLSGTYLLNDDNPIVRLNEDEAVAYGSPWSGKTHCYLNKSAPVAAFVRLKQAPYNEFAVKEDVDAFKALLPGCSVVRHDPMLHSSLCATLIGLSSLVIVGEMACLPDKEAAEICYANVIPSEAGAESRNLRNDL